MDLLASESIWVVYLGLLIGPFVQEDLAVVGAAGLSAANPHLFPIIFPLVFVGLMASDLWKYFIGKFARTYDWAKRYSQKPKVAAASTLMRDRPAAALMAARFVPLTRVPAYVAAGFVGVPYHIYAVWVTLSGLLYCCIIFALFHLLGEVLGEQIKGYLPFIAIGTVALLFVGRVFWKRLKA